MLESSTLTMNTPLADTVQPLLECLGTAAFAVDAWGNGWFRFAAANQRFLDAIGEAAVVGRSPAEILPEDFAQDLETRCQRCLDSAKQVTWEAQLSPQASRSRWWRIDLAPVIVGDQCAGRVVATVFDITEQTCRERDLLNRDRAMRAAVEALDQGVAIWGADERLIHCNRRYRDHHPHIADSLRPGAAYRRLLWEEAAARAGSESRGTGLCIDTDEHAGFDGGLITISSDVTERNHYRRASTQNRAALTAMLDGLDEAVLWLSADGTMTACNPAAARWLEADPQALAGRTLASHMDADTADRVTSLIRDTTATGEPRHTTLKQGEHRFDVVVCPLPGATGALTATCVIVRDRSELDTAAASAREYQQLLARYMRIASLGEMAGALAHEVSQPIAAVVNYCRGSVNQLSSGKGNIAEVVEALSEACDEAERASAIIQNIIGMIRRSPGNRVSTDVAAVVNQTCRRLAKDAQKSGVDIAVDLPPDLPHIPVNAVELEQVVFNLVKNAIEAVAAAGPEGDDRRVRVRAGVTDDGAVEVAVADSGPGFAEGDAETAFAPFFTTKPGGIGMGLAICRAIIEGFGGDMSAANNADGGESGGGAVVSFRIPIEDQDHVT